MKPEDLMRKVDETIRSNGLLSPGNAVLLGLSGGPDSTCLLLVLHALRQAYCLDIHAVYVNHNLRPDETPAETAFCRSLCEGLGIAFMQRSVDVVLFSKARRISNDSMSCGSRERQA